MPDLKTIFEQNTGNLIHKWMHYFDIYERYFSKYVNRDVIILEIGVFQGGSLKMWKEYFGSRCRVYGIDINPLCKQFEEDGIEIFIGSQSDREFLRSVKQLIPKVDILIDDGGHTMEQQVVSFEELFEHIKDDGIYLCEDMHTSYWPVYGGGYQRKGSFVEFTKQLVDQLNAWHSKDPALSVNVFTRTAYAMHYYDSVLVIEKQAMQPPAHKRTGKEVIPITNFDYPLPGHKQSKKKRVSMFRKLLHITGIRRRKS